MKKNKYICILFVLITLFSVFNTVNASNLTKSYSWCFRPTTNGAQPQLFGGSTLPLDYGALALGSPDEKVVFLTFDMGYVTDDCLKIIEVLKKHSVTGAFFILPNVIRTHPELLSALASNGNLICNHTYSHRDMSKINEKEEFLGELSRLEDLYTEKTGLVMEKFYRPPQGTFSESNLIFCRESGYTPVFWSFAYADWDKNAQLSVEKAKKKIFDNAHNGMVLLLHPASSTNAKIMEDVIVHFKEQGYRFGGLKELYVYSSYTR